MRTAGWLRSFQQGAMYDFTLLVGQALCTRGETLQWFYDCVPRRLQKIVRNTRFSAIVQGMYRWDLHWHQGKIFLWTWAEVLTYEFHLWTEEVIGPKVHWGSQRNCTGSISNISRLLSLKATASGLLPHRLFMSSFNELPSPPFLRGERSWQLNFLLNACAMH